MMLLPWLPEGCAQVAAEAYKGASSNGRAPVLYAVYAGSIPAAPINASLAQQETQLICNHQAVGSSPVGSFICRYSTRASTGD